ncbi:4-(cytidine 5'-diphospho)-2-C-methyl-D-erythritol kinase [Aestuariibacter sp. A3R04]|uniref:4-(cytidine 5'-diphospho)-2-C-methyl-D-erythritol kinase n=1 Tax=Aestuariibacter sp. A3R04 TaxID=2841571 RepID=UPI001C0A1688|nr:4-(cytidine 5'-diphospho)-2-C-methyl-D-erythritol kinase [Aestuariibacter sp. A3R04]MBU3022576.1 4-(cytidine 5'-diphospho)-2-C-methyl-D-erythritol kinase [Aestuariibacter sp. A3R04]
MPQQVWWPSPAKLNLFLHILGRYENGYHQLQTLFQLLNVGDELAFRINDSGKITLSPSLTGVKDEDNLVVRAARLLQQYAKVAKGANIFLKKQLPMGGGIGGGSSNAATTLVVLNKMWQCGLSTQALARLGLSLGADVPVFVNGATGFAGGVGETISPVALPEKWYAVINPGVHVSTANIFSEPTLPRDTPAIAWEDYSFDSTRNDCQSIVCKMHPEVANLLQWLVHYAPSRMTGTGACVFAVFDNEASAQKVVNILPEHWNGFVAKGVNTSPLQEKLERVNEASDMN